MLFHFWYRIFFWCLICTVFLCVYILQKKLIFLKKTYDITLRQFKLNNSTTLSREIFYSTHSCLLDPTKLDQELFINYNQLKSNYLKLSRQVTSDSQFRRLHSQFVPIGCTPILTVALIIPIRNRTNHLHILLGHLHPFLQKQLLRYQFYVAHQIGNLTFNKGRLMNTAFQYAVEDGEKSGHPYDCFIFHDVDLLPESELNFYRCGWRVKAGTPQPIYHLAHTIEKFLYKSLCCGLTVGGVIAFTKEQYQMLNGYSNEFWGWGGEDDDMFRRIKKSKIPVQRIFNAAVNRYTMIRHKTDRLSRVNHQRHSLLKGAESRYNEDGLSNLNTRITSAHFFPLYVNISVDVGLPNKTFAS